MKVIIYDRNPGVDWTNKFLKLCWALGARLQVLFGVADACYGAGSWNDVYTWLASLGPCQFELIQYWGHGSPGCVWLHSRMLRWFEFINVLRPLVTKDTVLWFRTCNSFRGTSGQEFSRVLANGLRCTVAGHTRTIGLIQGGLHTRKQDTLPSWRTSEGELPDSWLPGYMRWGPNSVWFWQTKIPEGW